MYAYLQPSRHFICKGIFKIIRCSSADAVEVCERKFSFSACKLLFPTRETDFLVFRDSKPALGTTQSLLKWAQEYSGPEHSLFTSNAELMNEWIYTSTPHTPTEVALQQTQGPFHFTASKPFKL